MTPSLSVLEDQTCTVQSVELGWFVQGCLHKTVKTADGWSSWQRTWSPAWVKGETSMSKTINHKARIAIHSPESFQGRCTRKEKVQKHKIKLFALWISVVRIQKINDREILSILSYQKTITPALREKYPAQCLAMSEIFGLLYPEINPAVILLLATSNLSHNYPIRFHLCSYCTTT